MCREKYSYRIKLNLICYDIYILINVNVVVLLYKILLKTVISKIFMKII